MELCAILKGIITHQESTRLKDVHVERTFLAHCGFRKIMEDKLTYNNKNNKNNVEDLVREYDGLMTQDDEAHMRRERKKDIYW